MFNLIEQKIYIDYYTDRILYCYTVKNWYLDGVARRHYFSILLYARRGKHVVSSLTVTIEACNDQKS